MMISQRWIDQQKTLAATYANPEAKAAKLAEIAEAEKKLAEQKGQLASHGLRLNSYPGVCVVTGEKVDGGMGYCRQDAITKKWLTYSKRGASEVFGIK